MERIASFTVDHTVLEPGLYLSWQDGNVVTFDLRFKKPNTATLRAGTRWSTSAPWDARRVFTFSLMEAS